MVNRDDIPHIALIEIKWTTHELKPNGQIDPSTKDYGRKIVSLRNDDKDKCTDAVKTLLIEFLERMKANGYYNEEDNERFGESQVCGSGGTQTQRTEMLGMRGGPFRRDGN